MNHTTRTNETEANALVKRNERLLANEDNKLDSLFLLDPLD